MRLVAGENDRFGQHIPALHPDALFFQELQVVAHYIPVEHPRFSAELFTSSFQYRAFSAGIRSEVVLYGTIWVSVPSLLSENC
jgi:hypothetical protein